MSIGIFLPNWLGDLVMATPAIRAVRDAFPEERIVGIVRPHLADALAGSPWLDELWRFDPRSSWPQMRRLRLLRRLRRERFDSMVLLTHSLHTALLAWLGGARRRIGYALHRRGALLSDKLYPRYEAGRILPEPMVDTYLRIAEELGCSRWSRNLELFTTATEEALGDSVWRNLGFAPDARVVALNCSGAYGAAKLWPTGHFIDLARAIVDELDHEVLVICGPGERETARDIAARAARRRVVSLADQPLSIATTKACLRRVAMAVSTDSGPRHIAAAFGKPVVTLFGPTLPVWVDNPTVRGEHLRIAINCSGCGQRTCPLGHHRCMRDLAPATVFEAVGRWLGNAGITERCVSSDHAAAAPPHWRGLAKVR